MSNHTPGPWAAHTNGLDYFVTAKDFHGAECKVVKMYIAEVKRFRDAEGEMQAEANANLVAAAPELLRIAEESLSALAELSRHCYDGIWGDKLRNAIANAMGDTNG